MMADLNTRSYDNEYAKDNRNDRHVRSHETCRVASPRTRADDVLDQVGAGSFRATSHVGTTQPAWAE
jgi:hypothetical protein